MKPATALVRERHLAGVLLLGGAVVDGAQVMSLNSYLAGADPDRDWPVMVATDEEGGVVQRLRPAIGYVSAFMAAGANPDVDEASAYYTGLGTQLAMLGFTMDMAPVADVTVGLGDPTIRTRSAGSDPQVVDRAVAAAWTGLDAGGVTPVVKHFPGHGSVAVDSHAGLPHQAATLAELSQRDFVPFADAITSGAPAVMMGHIQVAAWGDAPATVNPLAYSYLRDELGFDGVIMTDAMNMEAITDLYAPGAATVAALECRGGSGAHAGRPRRGDRGHRGGGGGRVASARTAGRRGGPSDSAGAIPIARSGGVRPRAAARVRGGLGGGGIA